MSKKYSPIFIGGAGRSGTTLLRVMLNSHPNLCSGPEFKVIPTLIEMYKEMNTRSFEKVKKAYILSDDEIKANFSRFIISMFQNFRKKSGGKRLVEKTPHNSLIMKELSEILPEAKFIHVVRDGRDVAKSLTEMNWVDFNDNRVWYIENITAAATYWGQTVAKAVMDSQSHELKNKVLLVRYEDLIESPEKTMREVLGFIGEPWSDSVLKHHTINRNNEPKESSTEQVSQALYRSSLYRWKTEYSQEDITAFKTANVDEVLILLGYEITKDW